MRFSSRLAVKKSETRTHPDMMNIDGQRRFQMSSTSSPMTTEFVRFTAPHGRKFQMPTARERMYARICGRIFSFLKNGYIAGMVTRMVEGACPSRCEAMETKNVATSTG